MIVPNIINKQLLSGETVVYTGSGGFHYDGQSFVGTHTLCMTSQGRVIVHDTGGVFGSETVRTMNVNPGKIQISSFSDYGINLTSVDFYPFSFNFKVPIKEFETCLNDMPYECFLFTENSSSEIPVYVEYDEGGYSYMTMGMTKDQLDLTNGYPRSVHTIPFHRITQINNTGAYSAVLKGFFDKENKQVLSVRLFIPSKGKLAVLMALWKNTVLLSDLTGPIRNIFPARFSGLVDGSRIENQEVTLVHKADDNIALVDEVNWTLLNEFHLNEEEWYYQKNSNRTLVLKQDIPYIIDVKRSDAVAFAERAWVSGDRILHNGLGALYGVYQEVAYDGEEAALLVDKPHGMKLIQWKTMELISSSSAHQPEIIDAGERMFLLQGAEIAMVTWKNHSWSSNFDPSVVRKLEDHKIGYTSNEQPYYYTQTEQGITFSQRADTFLHSMKSQAVTDISVSEAVGESGDFASVRIHTAEDSEDSFFMLPVQEVPGIIYTTYQQRKAPIMGRIPPAQLYLSWSRQVNDFALYHLFGQLYALQAGIEQIQKDVPNRDECNRRLLNFLYYAIQNQKRRLDQVSIYLPAMLEKNSRAILSGAHQHEQPFRYMQQSFMNISTKMRQTLSEIEGALSPVNRLIIPKGDIENIIVRREKRGYAQSAITVGLGAALAIGTGGLAVPLIMGGMFLGANSFFTAKDARQKAEMDALFDHNSLDFYMTKALDTFYHLMDTLIPYHVAEANRHMTVSFEQLAPMYKSALMNPAAADHLFKEISQYYTFKQLPIDHSVVMPKKALIERVQDSSNTADLYIQLFQNEVTYDVPEQAEKSRIGTS